MWSAAGFCFEICKNEKTLSVAPEAVYVLLPLSCLFCPYALSFIYLLYLPVSCLRCAPCHPALFAEVLEKTVDGEAAALTKAKTLYKSCIGDRKWAFVSRPDDLSSMSHFGCVRKVNFLIQILKFIIKGKNITSWISNQSQKSAEISKSF